MTKPKFLSYKYGHAWVFLYAFIYIAWFIIIERIPISEYHYIHSPLDDLIPFCEYFVIPYYIWFPYMLVVFLFIFFTSRTEFYQTAALIISGMTLFLIVSSLYPNAHTLRPDTFANDNIFTQLVSWIYSMDTPTNILPSIHVYNSIGCHIAIMKCKRLENHHVIKMLSLVTAVSIILSTVFIKQHSVIDGFLAITLIGIMYPLVYVIPKKIKKNS